MYIKRTSADAGFGTGSGRICFFSNSGGRGSVLVGDFFEIFLMKGALKEGTLGAGIGTPWRRPFQNGKNL
jgi:hypothetical protein